MTVTPAFLPAFPFLKRRLKAATKATESIVNYAISKLAGKKSEAEIAAEVMNNAVREMGITSRHSVDAMAQLAERVALSERASPATLSLL